MGTRFWVFGLVLACILASAFVSLRAGESTVLELFGWLALVLVTCAIGLWPFAGRDQRAELELERQTWADNIEFRETPAVPRTAMSGRGAPGESRTIRCD
jgi:hypothetical protein